MTNVEEEVMAAYSDCNQDSYKYGSGERNLHFRASEQVSVEEAQRIMEKAIPGGYNAFKADLLDHLPTECKVQIAREYSVCIYVEFTEEVSRPSLFDAGRDAWAAMNAAEVDRVQEYSDVTTDGFIVRFWWD